MSRLMRLGIAWAVWGAFVVLATPQISPGSTSTMVMGVALLVTGLIIFMVVEK